MNPEDEFVKEVERILGEMEEEEDWDDELEDPGYDKLSKKDLMDTFFDLKQDLLRRGVLLEPVTSEDMSKQSTYLGLLNEMRKREMS